MRQYRIKSKRKLVFPNEVKYYVQVKFEYIPFWVTVTPSFEKLSQAKEYIELIRDISYA